MVVYLAGGMVTDWQDRVKRLCPGPIYLDPRDWSCCNPQEYAPRDLRAIRLADIIFAYFETGNPTGYGMALEIGYARALNKQIIFVDEKCGGSRATDMLRACADIVAFNFEAGVGYLKMLLDGVGRVGGDY